jgi:NAD(P)H dehydrogenase (quinone)
MSTKVQIVFYSMYGHVYKMAEAVAEGARSVSGAEVELYQVPELVPDEALKRTGADAARKEFAHIPIADRDKLPDADAILFGTPTRFGCAAAQVRNFIDQCGGLWAAGRLIGKVGGVFASTGGSQHFGQETTITTFLPTLLHFGMIVVGIPASESRLSGLETVSGGTPYGATTFADHDSKRLPSENEPVIARFQGEYTTEIAKKLKGK